MNDQRRIVARPDVCFGEPHIEGTRVTCWGIYDRHRAGDSLESIADDFDVSVQAVERAFEFHCAYVHRMQADRRVLAEHIRDVCRTFERDEL